MSSRATIFGMMSSAGTTTTGALIGSGIAILIGDGKVSF
jgi:hypothetical protein